MKLCISIDGKRMRPLRDVIAMRHGENRFGYRLIAEKPQPPVNHGQQKSEPKLQAAYPERKTATAL